MRGVAIFAGALVVGIALALKFRQGTSVAGQGETPPLAGAAVPSTKIVTRTVYVNVPGPTTTRTITKTNTVATPAPSITRTITSQGLTTLAPVIPTAIDTVAQGAATFVRSGSTLDLVNPGETATSYQSDNELLSPVTDKLANALSSVGTIAGDATPFAGVFAVDAGVSGFRGASEKAQAGILGASTVKTIQFGLNYVPILGTAASAVLGLLAGTGTGSKVVGAAGTGEEQVYQAQKDAVNQTLKGNVVGAVQALTAPWQGGSSHAEREATYQANVAFTNKKLGLNNAADALGDNATLQATRATLGETAAGQAKAFASYIAATKAWNALVASGKVSNDPKNWVHQSANAANDAVQAEAEKAAAATKAANEKVIAARRAKLITR